MGGCSSDSSTGPNTQTQSFVYPLTTGNSWSYSFEQIISYTAINDPPETTDVIVDVVDVGTIRFSRDLFAHVLEATMHTDTSDIVARQLLWNRDDALVATGYCGDFDEVFPGMVLPNSHSPGTFLCRDGRYNSSDGDLTVLPYPLELGKTWTYHFLGITRHSAGWERITYAGGEVWAYRIEWEYPDDPGVTTTEYVSALGLVRRDVIELGVLIPRANAPFGNVIADITTKVELLEFRPG